MADTKYVYEVSKKLEAFGFAKEWSDFISQLKSLDSTIKQFNLDYIPKREILCKRLNQCLNPLLPAGVHIKVLETYSIIFECISREELINHFTEYTLGLFTFGPQSRILVIGAYLNVLDKYIIPLGRDVESFCSNILIGLLPSLESNSNEFYNRSFILINKFKSLIDIRKFYIGMWTVLQKQDALHIPVINYLLSNDSDFDFMISDKRLIISGLKKCLQSNETLVLRNTLDLINILFPLRKKLFTDKLNIELLKSMLLIFCKRELGLNRRVYVWLEMTEDDIKNCKFLKNALLQILINKETTKQFFKIFSTLLDKLELNEKLLEEMIFCVIIYICDLKLNHSDNYENLLIVNNNYQEELINLSQQFISTDLDKLWKVFYLKLKEAIYLDQKNSTYFKKNNSNNFENINENARNYDLTNNCSKDNIKNSLILFSEENEKMKNEINTMINQSDLPDFSFDVLSNDGKSMTNKTFSDEYKKSNKISKKDKKKLKVNKVCTPNDVLNYLNFCITKYQVFDSTVLKTHLPILISYILENKIYFDNKNINNFFTKTIGIIDLKNQSEQVCENFYELIDQFYVNEDAEIISRIDKSFLTIIVSHLMSFISEENYFIFFSLVIKHKDKYNFDFYLSQYFNLMISKSTDMIKNSVNIFSNISNLDSTRLFNELWKRLSIQMTYPEDSYGNIYNISQSNLLTFNTDLQTMINPCHNNQSASFKNVNDKNYLALHESSMKVKNNQLQYKINESVHTHKSNKQNNENSKIDLYRKKQSSNEQLVNTKNINYPHSKKNICEAIFEYNILFNRCFELILERKVNDTNKHKLCLFLFFVLELDTNNSHYFFNIFFLLNSKISSYDPVITSLIKSIISFKSVFYYLIKKLEESDIKSNDYVYETVPKFTQISNVLVTFKNILTYSCRFRNELNLEIKNGEIFIALTNSQVNTLKEALFAILKYLFICKAPLCSNTYEDLRKIKIQSIEIISFMVEKNILKKDKYINNPSISSDLTYQMNNVNVCLNFNLIVKICFENKNDPAMILPAFDLIKISNNTSLFKKFLKILDENCFYYIDLIEKIINLEKHHTVEILPFILENLTCDGYSFLIVNEIIKEMINIDCVTFNWAKITKKLINDYIDFFSQTNLNSRIYNLLVNAIVETSNILFKTFSGYFIEYLTSSNFCPEYILALDFRPKLYFHILISYSINQSKFFTFLIKVDQILDFDEKIKNYNHSLSFIHQIANYRALTEINTLIYLLNVLSEMPNESSFYLSSIYQTIAYMQKSVVSKNDKFKLLDVLCQIKYNDKIKSALQTVVGYIFELSKSSDKNSKSYAIDKLLDLLENETVTIKNISAGLFENLNNSDFFQFKLKEKIILYKSLSEYKLDLMDEIILKIESSFFVSAASDINNKCSVLKRIAFLLYAGEYNKYSSFHTKLIETCVNLLQHNSVKVKKKTWFLIRIMCLKINHRKLIPIFPTLYCEILSLLIYSQDLNQLAPAIKFLDLIFLLDTDETVEFKINLLGQNNIKLDQTNDRNLFKICFEKIKDLELPKKNLNFFDKKRLFFYQKILKIDDIANFYKFGSYFYHVQDNKCEEIDYEALEKSIFGEFND